MSEIQASDPCERSDFNFTKGLNSHNHMHAPRIGLNMLNWKHTNKPSSVLKLSSSYLRSALNSKHVLLEVHDYQRYQFIYGLCN